MNNEILHNDIDDFLKTKFENHAIIPNEELWEKIAPRIMTATVAYSKYIWMRNAFIGTAVSLVGVVFLLLALNTNLLNIKDQGEISLSKTTEIQNNSTKVLPLQEINTNTKNDKVSDSKSTYLSYKSNNSDKKKVSAIVLSTNSIVNIFSAIDEPDTLTEQTSTPESTIVFTTDSLNCPDTNSTKQLADVDTSAYRISNTWVAEIDKSKTNKSKLKNPILELPDIGLNHRNTTSLNPILSSRKHLNKNKISIKELVENFEIGICLNPTLSTRTISQIPNLENSTYDRQYYNDIEKSLITGSTGLDITYIANINWSLMTGIHVSNYKNETQSDALHREVISPNELMLFTSAGKIPIYGTEMDKLPLQSVLNTNINLTYIEIPFIVRYNLSPDFYLDAGMSYSYLSSLKTKITAEDYNADFHYSKLEGININSFSTLVGFGLYYEFTSKLRFEIGPEIKWQINAFDAVGVVTHPLYIGLHAGLKYRFK